MNPKKTSYQHDTESPDQLRLPVGAAEEDIGARLRQQRLQRKIAIEDAARALKLARVTLEDIERGDLGRHQSLYRRGYVRNYARFLGLDPAPLLEMLQSADLPPLRSALPVQSHGPNFEKYLKIATYAIVTTLIIPPLVLIYIQGGLDFLDRERPLALKLSSASPVAQDEAGPGPVAASTMDVELQRDSASSGPVTASALPLSYIRPVRDAIAEERAAAPDTETLASGSEGFDPRSVLAIELLDDSWLEVYAADGQRLEFDLLRAGDQRRFLAEAPFRVLLGRGSAVSLELDGQAIEFEGHDRADVVTLELSPEGVVLR